MLSDSDVLRCEVLRGASVLRCFFLVVMVYGNAAHRQIGKQVYIVALTFYHYR